MPNIFVLESETPLLFLAVHSLFSLKGIKGTLVKGAKDLTDYGFLPNFQNSLKSLVFLAGIQHVKAMTR